MTRIKAGLYRQASGSRQPHLNRSASRRRCLFRYRGNFHRNELRRFHFANSLLPLIKPPIAESPITTKGRNSLAARNLLGNQPSPLRPLFRSPAFHTPTLQHDKAIYKMGFT